MKQWKQAIEQWLDSREDQLVRQIGQLVAVPSVGGPAAGPGKPFGEGAAQVLEVAAALAEEAACGRRMWRAMCSPRSERST